MRRKKVVNRFRMTGIPASFNETELEQRERRVGGSGGAEDSGWFGIIPKQT